MSSLESASASSPTVDVVALAATYAAQLPDNFADASESDQRSMLLFLDSLTPIQLRACAIAKDNNGTSHSILRCNLYLKWAASR